MIGTFAPIGCYGNTHTWDWYGNTTNADTDSSPHPNQRCCCGMYRWRDIRPPIDDLIDLHEEYYQPAESEEQCQHSQR